MALTVKEFKELCEKTPQATHASFDGGHAIGGIPVDADTYFDALSEVVEAHPIVPQRLLTPQKQS